MPKQDFLHACSELAGDACETMEAALEQIERLLGNMHETPARKTRARAHLQRLLECKEAGPLEREVVRLRHSYQEQGPSDPAQAYGFERLPGLAGEAARAAWRDWAERLAQSRERGAIRAFGEHFCQRVEMALPPAAARQEALLLELRPILRQVAERLGGEVSESSRQRLNDWLRKAEALERRAEARRYLDELQALREAQAWHQLGERLQAADALADGEPDIREPVEALRKAFAAWRLWKERGYPELLAALRTFTPSARAVLPCPQPLPFAQVREALAGLTAWRAEAERQALTDRLQTVAAAAEQALALAEGKEGMAQLQQAKADWAEAGLGEGFPAPPWDALQRRLWEAADRAFEAWRSRLLADFSGSLEAAPPLLSPAAQQQLAELQGQARRIVECHSLLRVWHDTAAPPELAELPAQAQWSGLAEDMEAMRAAWGRAPLFKESAAMRSLLAKEAELLRKSRQLMVGGNLAQWEQAVAELGGATSAAAQAGRKELEQLCADQRMTDAINQGRWADMAARVGSASLAVQALWQRVQAGAAFLRRFEQRLAQLESLPAFAEFAEQALALSEARPTGDVQFATPDALALQRLREDLQDCLLRRVDQDIQRLAERCRAYPPMAADDVKARAKDCALLRESLAWPAFQRQGGQYLLPRLEAIEALLALQELLGEQDWAGAEAHLRAAADRLEPPVRRGGWLALASARLPPGRESDLAWLALFRDYPQELLADAGRRRHYLALLRRARLPDGDVPDHARLLERHFPEQAYLRGLLRLRASPENGLAALGEQAPQPEPEDCGLLGALLQEWVERPVPVAVLKRLWDGLAEPARALAWPYPSEPLLLHRQRFDAQAAALAARMQQTGTALRDLEAAWRALQAAYGYAEASALSRRLADAAQVEAMMETLAHGDPWGGENRKLLDAVGQQCGLEHMAEVCRSRGWIAAVDARKRGMRAWDALEGHWQEFRQRFARLETPLPLVPAAWENIVDTLALWDSRLAAAAKDIDPRVPRAGQDRRWAFFMSDWGQSHECRLAAQFLGKNPPAENIQELSALYAQALAQARGFAALHRRLLETVPRDAAGAGPLDRAVRLALKELHETRPKTRPVELLRGQLMDARTSHFIGAHYQAWLRQTLAPPP